MDNIIRMIVMFLEILYKITITANKKEAPAIIILIIVVLRKEIQV